MLINYSFLYSPYAPFPTCTHRPVAALYPVFYASCKKNDLAELGTTAAGAVSSDVTAYTITTYKIAPKTADAATTTALSNHLAFISNNPVKKNVLYVFLLPGTYRNPEGCQATTLKAASLGYHAIGLMYDNTVPGNPLCKGTGDTTCHLRARLEVIDGTDRSTGVNVNVANSLVEQTIQIAGISKQDLPWPELGPVSGWKPA